MLLHRTALSGVLLLFLAACSGEKASPLSSRFRTEEESASSRAAAGREVSDAVLSVHIVSESSLRESRLKLSVTGFRPEDGEIEWLVDGAPVPGAVDVSFPADARQKGESVQARVTVGGTVLFSNVVTLSNRPPEILSARLVPEVVRPGDSLGVDASGSDPDGDEVTFEYAWKKNGVPAGTGSRLGGTLKRNDRFSVTITPFDGTARGRSVTLEREVRNYPPSIDGVADARLVEQMYTCKVQAKDGDGDPLTYELRESPPGMTIDPATGAIRWKVPLDTRGKVPVTVSVSDGKGGDSSYAMFVTIREEPAE